MPALVSIVIPTYNRAKDLRRALKSVFAQSYSHWEALVVDNHSNDDTDRIVEDFQDPRIRLLKIHNEGIIARSRNLGIKNAKGEYVAFLDSDDWWSPQKLTESVKFLQCGADIIYHDLFIVTKLNQRFFYKKTRTRSLKQPIFYDLLCYGNALNNSSVVVRKEYLYKINGLSEDRNLIAAEDYDAWIKIAKLTERFVRVPRTLGYYWAGGENVSNPECTLKTLAVIEECYAQVFDDLTKNNMQYTKGRTHYLMASYEIARKYLQLISLRKVSLSTYVKSKWMLLLISLFIGRHQE